MAAYIVKLEIAGETDRRLLVEANSMYEARQQVQSLVDELKSSFVTVSLAKHGPNGDIPDCLCNVCTYGIGG